jgi:hypothetical protein
MVGSWEGRARRGWILLQQAFSPAVAQAVCSDLGTRIGIDLARPEQWTQPRVWLREMRNANAVQIAMSQRESSTAAIRDVADQLIADLARARPGAFADGTGRVSQPDRLVGTRRPLV